MNLNNRQKWGIGLIVSGILSAAVGVGGLAFQVTPEWVSGLMNVVTAVSGIFGIALNLPSDTSGPKN